MNQVNSPSNGEQLDLFATDSVLGSNLDTLKAQLLPNSSPVPNTAIKPSKALEYKWIKRAGKLHGPYLYLRWRENGRQRSQYIGKALCDPRLARTPGHQ